MNKETETTYLQNIEESVFDEDKIVTYKWLSKYLGLHVNISKQLLYTYAKNCPRRNEISLTYLVAGIPKNGEGVEMCVVRESDLERAKEGLQRITSEHVYSIQKVPYVTDLNVLYTADKAESFESEDNTKLSSIEFDCGKRDDSFFEKLKAKTAAAVKTEVPSSAKPKPSQPENKGNKDSGAAVINGTKVGEENTADKGSSKKVVVPSMFARTKAAATNKQVNNTKANGVPSKTSKQTGLAAFLSKAPPVKPKEENSIQENNKHEDIKDVKSDEKNNKEVDRSDENNGRISDEMEVEVINGEKENCSKQENVKSDVKKNTTVVKEKKKETKKGTKRPKKSNKEDLHAKKRRRIIVMDSDSDSDEESMHSEREPTPPPPRPATPPADDDVISATPEPTTKHQRRRFVNKSYVDSDGFIVTKKEYVFEDCSDTENGESEKQVETKEESTRTKSESPENKPSKEEDTESQKEDSVLPHKNKNNVDSKKKPAPVKSTKNSKKQSPRKASSPKKNKQQSITNFFAKKT